MTIIKTSLLIILGGEGGIAIPSLFSLSLEERRWEYWRMLAPTSDVVTKILSSNPLGTLLLDGFSLVLPAVW